MDVVFEMSKDDKARANTKSIKLTISIDEKENPAFGLKLVDKLEEIFRRCMGE